MAGIVYKYNNKYTSLTGSEYTQPNAGTARLCVKYGTSTVKYGLTTNTSASQYCGIRMKVNNGIAYIGRTESTKTTVNTSSSTSIRTTLTSSSLSESRSNYQTSSVSYWNSTSEEWYKEETPRSSTGKVTGTYLDVYNNSTITTSPYSRTLTVTETNYKHEIVTYSWSDIDWSLDSASSASSLINSYSVSSNCATQSYMMYTSSTLYSTLLLSQGNYTTSGTIYNSTYSTIGSSSFSKHYPTAGTVTISRSDIWSGSFETYTSRIIRLGVSGVYITMDDGYKITAYSQTVNSSTWTLNTTSFTETYVTTHSGTNSATKGNWLRQSTRSNITYTATRPNCAPYKASTTGATKTVTYEAQATSSSASTSYWTETKNVSKEVEYIASSGSTWDTYSMVTEIITGHYTTSTKSINSNYSYTTSISTHNYNI